MDFQLEELQALSVGDVVRESIRIPRAAPRTFAMITLSFIFPLSFAILAHSLLTHPIIRHLQLSSAAAASAAEWARLFSLQFAYLLFLFTFSLLSTAAVVFSVASLYASKPINFRSAISAVVPIFPRLFKTFLWVSLLMLVYNLAFLLCIVLLFVLVDDKRAMFFILLAILVGCFLIAHVGISALWHLASVISVLEPLCGLAAMRKSYQLLHGRARMAVALVVIYLGVCGALGWAFRAMVVKGTYEEGSFGFGAPTRFFAGTVLVMLLVLVNLVGLLVQSVFYYVCKSYHHQSIDRSALYDHLGGYLGEYVPLKSSIQMESL